MTVNDDHSSAAPGRRICAELRAPTPQTLRYLRAALGVRLPNACDAKSARSQARRDPKPKASVIRRPPVRSTGKQQRTLEAAVQIHPGNDAQIPDLSERDRLQVATEVFNFTIKRLAEAVKELEITRLSASPGKPLLCPNRQDHAAGTNRFDKAGAKAVTKSTTEDKTKRTPDVEVVVECSHSALQHLRKCRGTGSQQNGSNTPGEEKGALVLLERTISLGLTAQAIRQLSEIHQMYLEGQIRDTSPSASYIAQLLLGRLDAADDLSVFGFTENIQSQGVRLALLLGPACVSPELVKTFRPDTVGGPTWIILDGLRKGRLEPQQAGSRLQSIALAVSRLSSLAIKSADEKAAPRDFMALFDLSMNIKLESWTILDSKIDTAKQIWQPFHYALKQLSKYDEDLSTSSEYVLRSLLSLRNSLRAASCEPDMPLELAEILSGIPHTPDSFAVLATILEETLSRSKNSELAVLCQITTTRLKAVPHDLAATTSSVTKIERRLEERVTLSRAEILQILPHLSRLRKAFAAFVTTYCRQDSIPAQKKNSLELRDDLVRLMHACFGFLERHLTTVLGQKLEAYWKEGEHGFVMSLLKTADTVLSAIQTVAEASGLAQIAGDALRNCSVTLQRLQVEYASAITRSLMDLQCYQLRVRLSQAFWTRYLAAIKQREAPQRQADILELSVQGLLELPASHQRTAYAALKFERLASCYLEVRNFGSAATALKNATATNISQGVLSNVVELLLSGPYHCAWSEMNPSFKALEAIEDLFYDDQALPAIHRAALLEKQLSSLIEVDIDSCHLGVCAKMVNKLHQLLDQPEYGVCRLRFVNRLFSIGLKRRLAASDFMVDLPLTQGLLSPPLSGKAPMFLSKFDQELRSLLSLQYGFFTETTTNEGLQEDVKQLMSILSNFANLEQAEHGCENLGSWTAPLLLAVDYAVMTEDSQTALMALDVLDHLAQLGVVASGLCRKSILTRKSNIYLRLHEVRSAEKSLAVADKARVDEKSDPLVDIDFALTYSEYHLQALGLEECRHWLDKAEDVWKAQQNPMQPALAFPKLKVQSLLCKATHLASRLAFQQCNLARAVILGRQSAKIAASLWPAIETSCTFPSLSKTMAKRNGESPDLSAPFLRLALTSKSLPRVTVPTAFNTSNVILCCSVFVHMAFLHSHCGVYNDAVVFYEQGLKVARKTSQSAEEIVAVCGLSVLHARAEQIEKANNSLRLLSTIKSRWESEWLRVFKSTSQVEAYLALGDLAAAHNSLSIGMQLQPALSHSSKAKSTTSKAKTPVSQRTTQPQRDNGIDTPCTSNVPTSTAKIDLRGVKATISALEARLHLLEHGEGAKTVSDADLERKQTQDGRTLVLVATNLVQSALETFAEDAVHSVLAETAVALPVRYGSAKRGGRVSFVQPASSQALVANRNRLTEPTSADDALTKGCAMLLEAQDILLSLRESESDRLSSDILSACHKTLTQISLLSTAVSRPMTSSSLNVVLDITSPLNLARSRENILTMGELSASQMTGMETWPNIDQDHRGTTILEITSAVDYDMQLLPESWSVVSIVLNEAKDELFVARLTHRKSPFVVRIPLARPDPSDGDTAGLDLEGAKEEMHEIIAKANATAHAASGSSSDKSVRKAWFAERQTLDEQLSMLLNNLENVWLGGFRGLLSSCRTDQDKLTAFGQRLCSSLNMHLPSRQKASKSHDFIELHDHVLELFVGLGHPQELDLEDAVTDLLYFVIDVLQFNGERNAYDEVDFDAILVEVLEAMHAYHDLRTDSAVEETHVILVLDKDLQIFPWESLPCLRGVAVSRMPSLGSIWQRLQTMCEAPHRIPRNDGAYILNPSSDLKSTQETFGTLLETQLSGYKAIVNRAPEANEFETALKEHDLLLYFGHGGGGQYVRPRAIRRMDKCATTLLMGCSSAKMTECGVYEPYGMPFNYINGGSPAVVGTLWDVTDRDIDRFALELMEDWGLLRRYDNDSAPCGKKSSKRARKTKDAGSQRQPVSLDQAVANAREACLLKYLNGAAPVMYGVPVMLE